MWVLNVFLLLQWTLNRPAYDAAVAQGAQMFACISWDQTGRSIPGQCSDPMPVFDPATGVIITPKRISGKQLKVR